MEPSSEREVPRPLAVHRTPIPGLLVIDLPVHGDDRGWFKENWQREKMVAAGLPDFGPVQNNISFNQQVGVTRGIHAEPWDKYVSVAAGRVFGAWVDLREGPTFGTAHHLEITPDTAVFVPRGVGNAFQTLDAPAVYTYLVNDHWSEQSEAQYTFVNLADESVRIPWPIPLERAEVSAKDRGHPRLADVTPAAHQTAPTSPHATPASLHATAASPDTTPASLHATPYRPGRMLIVGASGQVGRALAERWRSRADVDAVNRAQLDLADVESIRDFDFTPYSVIVNAAACTAVDAAQTPQGRRAAWTVNVIGAGHLAEAARRTGAALVQLSSDYVFDGTCDLHDEHEPPSPLSVYGQTKAAADQLAVTVPEHYIVRTSWVIGAGRNFVRTMADLAQRGVDPQVVDDQVGRLSFADELAAAIDHLLTVRPEPGVYNVTGSGESMSWAGIAAQVFALTGHDPSRVCPVSTVDYYAAQGRAEGDGVVAPRPRHSTLDLARITAAGFEPQDHMTSLRGFLGCG